MNGNDDQADAVKWAASLLAELEAFTWDLARDMGRVIDSTAIVLDEVPMLAAPVHNSTTERCRIMDIDEPL